MRNIAEDYLLRRPELAGCFAGSPEECLRQRHGPAPWDARLPAALERHQTRIGHAAAPISGHEPLVVTGQQPGIFTGPLYTVYKAITAIQLAERLSRNSTVACRPLFWTASDDHDFEEIRSAHFLTRRHDLHSVVYSPGSGPDGIPCRMDATPAWRIAVQDSLHREIDLLAAVCRGSECTREVTDFLHESARQSSSLGIWFSRIMARLFPDAGLLFFAPEIPEARRAAIPVLQREIEAPLHSTRLLQEAGATLSASGYEAQIHREPDVCNFFLEVEERRRKVVFRSGRFQPSGTPLQYEPDEMLALLEAQPERFSPNVALRPIVQQAMFPVVAHVAGPGEIAYWAQLRPLFNFFGLPMPSVYPRASALLLSAKTSRLLREYGLQSEQLELRGPDLLTPALRRNAGNPALQAFAKDRAALDHAAAQLVEGLQRSGATRAAARFETAVQEALLRLERRLLYADQAHRNKVEAHLARLYNTIMPLGKPQERVLNIFSFLPEHGWPLIRRLQASLDLDRFTRQEVEL